MAGVTGHGGTFTFSLYSATFANYKVATYTTYTSIVGIISSISVESPQAMMVDMTGTEVTNASAVVLAPTGEWSGGSVSVDYIHIGGGADPQSIVRKAGQISFASPGYSVTRDAILESATTSASVGDIVRGTLKFRLTDYRGN